MKKARSNSTAIAACILSFALPALAEQATAPTAAKPQTVRLKNLTYAEVKLKEKERAADTKDKQMEFLGELEWLGTQYSFVGDTVNAIKAFERQSREYQRLNPDTRNDSSRIKNDLRAINEARAEDAVAAIVREAKDRQIVILNEAHHVPMHRAFAMLLARALKKSGFEYLACETCNPALSKLSQANNQYSPDSSSGFYVMEPMYANFMRDAIRANWKIVSYEAELDDKLSPDENYKLREITQAKNLVEAVFAKNPKAKLFIYVGYGHLSKVPLEGIDQPMMAGQLKALTGMDPLTIDQTVMYQHYASDNHSILYEAALKKQRHKPFVLKSKENAYLMPVAYKRGVDMQVVHPAYGMDPLTGRPGWMSALDLGFTPRDIPKDLLPPQGLPTQGRRLIYTYHLNDPIDAIPADLVLLEPGKPIPKLMLPKGEYRYAYED